MTIIIFSFTQVGATLSKQLQTKLLNQGRNCLSFTMEKYATSPYLNPFPKSLKETVSTYFKQGNVLIFIGACGIAVRSIAPFIDKKTVDPCVLSIDEKGQYVISLLSGHLGGGNEFASIVAKLLHATPIISTATDLNHQFAVDIFAKKNKCSLSNMTYAKEISARLLDHLDVGMAFTSSTELSKEETIPKGVISYDNNISQIPVGFCISSFSNVTPFPRTLHIIPKQVVLGIGCKKNTDPNHLKSFVLSILNEHHIYIESIACITSIDLKKDEPAILSLSKQLSVPFITYTNEELLSVPGVFTSSSFVKSITGVDNVCERSTLAYSGANELYLKKTALHGCTIAISLLPITCHF